MTSEPSTPPRPMTQLTGFLLRRAYVASVGAARACVPPDTGLREVAILAVLATRGLQSQREVAELLGVSQTTVGNVVDDLEGKGWVVRGRNPDDRRSHALAVTPAGAAAFVAFDRDLARGDEALTRTLSDAEVRRLHDHLTTLLDGDPAAAVEPLNARVSYLIARAHRGVRHDAERAFAPLGVHPRHFGVLSVVAADSPCTQSHLAARLGVSPPAALAMVDELEDRGLLDRRRRADDRRANDLTLTPAGKDLLAAAGQAAADAQQAIVRRLGAAADADLRRLLAAVSAAGGPAGLAAAATAATPSGSDPA